MTTSIQARSRSQNSRCPYLVRSNFHRFLCIFVVFKGASPRRRTRLNQIRNATRDHRSLFNWNAPFNVSICINFLVPLQFITMNDNNDRLRKARRTQISITLRFRGPLCRLNIQNRRPRTPSQRIITLTRKIRLSTTIFNSKRLRSTRKFTIRSRAMKVIIRSSSIIPTYGIGRLLMYLTAYVNANKRIKMVNPRSFRVLRIRLFRNFRIQLPSIFKRRIMVNSFTTRSFKRQHVNKVTQIKRRCAITQVNRYRHCVRSAFLQASRKLSFTDQIGFCVMPSPMRIHRNPTRLQGTSYKLMAINILVAYFITRNLCNLQ